MSLAVFKLESFTTAVASQGAQPVFSREALDQAFADGLAEGMARQQNEQVQALNAGLERLAHALANEEARRADLRREAVDALAPILEQVLDCLVPAAQSRRMEAALTEELLRLSRSAPPLRASISCGPMLRAMVERCLVTAGLDSVEITETESERISLSLQGGRIELDPSRITDGIRALITEIKGDEASWTH